MNITKEKWAFNVKGHGAPFPGSYSQMGICLNLTLYCSVRLEVATIFLLGGRVNDDWFLPLRLHLRWAVAFHLWHCPWQMWSVASWTLSKNEYIIKVICGGGRERERERERAKTRNSKGKSWNGESIITEAERLRECKRKEIENRRVGKVVGCRKLEWEGEKVEWEVGEIYQG